MIHTLQQHTPAGLISRCQAEPPARPDLAGGPLCDRLRCFYQHCRSAAGQQHPRRESACNGVLNLWAACYSATRNNTSSDDRDEQVADFRRQLAQVQSARASLVAVADTA